MESYNNISISVVKEPKCLILRYYDNQTKKYRKRIMPIREKDISDDSIDHICEELIKRHKSHLQSVPRQHIKHLLKLISQPSTRQFTHQSPVFEDDDDDEFVF